MSRADADGPAGTLVDHPGVAELVRDGQFSTNPQVSVRRDLHMVFYEATRLLFYRDAWESVPADGGLLLRMNPTGTAPFHLVFSQDELRTEFGHVTDTESWNEPRNYHWSRFPYRAVRFTTPPDDRERVLIYAEGA